MRIKVERFQFRDRVTIGKISIDGKETAYYTLEDKTRETIGVPVSVWKKPGETAIPVGVYSVVVDYSNRFKRNLPRLLDVPGFVGVRIHAGNRDKDTEGCILVGFKWSGGDYISESRVACDELQGKIEAALAVGEKVEIEIANAALKPSLRKVA